MSAVATGNSKASLPKGYWYAFAATALILMLTWGTKAQPYVMIIIALVIIGMVLEAWPTLSKI